MRPRLQRIREGVTALFERRRGDDGAPGALEDAFTCECGQGFRVTGRDRHRVLWPEGAGRDEPVLTGRCPACDRPLPGANAA